MENRQASSAASQLSATEKEVLSALSRWKMAMIYPNPAEVDAILTTDWT
ncbi:hypothetical protein [Persicitalea sp.]